MPASFIQASFAKGEIGRALDGRVDTAAYQVALRTARNVIIHPTGGVSNRAGTRFLAPVNDHTYPPRLIDFQFKTTDSYILEFGDHYMRVIRNDGHVVEAAKTITNITQANPAVVTAASHGYTTGDEIYIDSVAGMTKVNQQRYKVVVLTGNTFELHNQVTNANVNSTSYSAYTSGGTAARIYTLTTPYDWEDLLELAYVQSADVMTLTHPSYPPAELARTGHSNWTLTTISTGPAITFPRGEAVTVGTAGAVTYLYRVTAHKQDTLEESLPGLNTTTRTITAITKANPAVVSSAAHGFSNGDEVYIESVVGMTEVNGRRFVIANVAAGTFELQGIDSTSYTTYSSGGTANQTFVRITNGAVTANNTIAWSAVTGAERYSIYKFSSGSYGIIGQTEALSFVDSNIAPDTSISYPRAKQPFQDAGDYPATCSYYEQRRVFGGSDNEPDTTYFSQTGNHSNFNVSSPLQDDDAITLTLSARQVNKIRHYVPVTDLITFTSGSEWRINSGTDSAFAFDTVRQKPQSEWGCSYLRPILIGTTIIFAEENNMRVRSLGYSFQIDAYTGTSLSLLASHLLEYNTIVDWAYARTPDPRIYAIRDDGTMLTLTFDQEQEVIAWTRWDTDGTFERVNSLRNSTGVVGGEEGVYVVVRRVVNGSTVRYIEKVAQRRFTDVRDCFFVDCGLTYDNPLDITGISLANPVVITSALHGLSNGDQVDISDIVWETSYDDLDNTVVPDQLNGRRYYVASATTNTFALTDQYGANIDGTAFAAYVEGGYVRKAVLSVTGLDHLEGAEVSVLSDGNVVEDLVVTNGGITLPRRASRIHIGLKYIADIETLNIEAGQATIQGKMKSIPRVTLRLDKTRGLFVGPSEDQTIQLNLTEMKQREYELMGNPTDLFSKDKDIDLEPDWNSHGRIFIRQRYPLPITVLAVIPVIEIGED